MRVQDNFLLVITLGDLHSVFLLGRVVRVADLDAKAPWSDILGLLFSHELGSQTLGLPGKGTMEGLGDG